MPFQAKIINDPVYGFITIPNQLAFDIIEHPYFQRLRNIKQLGLSNYVYPGANHTRFHHAMGAMHLMAEVIDVLQNKKIEISIEEAEAAIAAILLHDIGHGPFSHCMEGILLQNIHHEEVSLLMMKELNLVMNGRLNMAIDIFTNNYHRKFLHQLVSSQLDVDRMDYLTRDSFYSGVAEGVISYDRIIKMLDVRNDELVVEEKGIYSIEKFLTSRRLMYWQVYLHKTVIAAEQLLVKIFERARELNHQQKLNFKTPALEFFLNEKNKTDSNWINIFASLTDAELLTNITYWQHETDVTLQLLSKMLLQRNLYKIELSNEAFDEEKIEKLRTTFLQTHAIDAAQSKYFVFEDSISNYAYSLSEGQIKIALKSGEVVDVLQLLTHLNIPIFTEAIKKHYVCYTI
jgi:HD superfamily phosphohydrolase